MKRFAAMALALLLTLTACASTPPETTVAPTTTTATVPETTIPPTTVPPTTVPPTTVPPTEPPPADYNPLTGEPLDEVNNARPYAIMINNRSKAVPQCGIGQADLLYEILAEGGITRFMAIFQDLEGVDVIGPVRSVRPYFVRMAQNYGAILSSAGGSNDAYKLIRSLKQDYLNGIANAHTYFYRDKWRRKNKGFEHSLMVTSEKLMQAAADLKMDTTMEDRDYGFFFDDEALLTGEAAAKITIRFTKNGKKTTMDYNAETGLYAMTQHGKASVDGNDDAPLVFRNVVILQAKTKVLDNAGHLSVQTTGEGDGWFAKDGQIIPIRWSREDNSSNYVYTDLEGNAVPFGVGKSYIAIIRTDRTPAWE